MSVSKDWLSRLLEIMTVRGELEIRCAYGAPWRIAYEPSPPGEIPFHVLLAGSAVLDCPGGETRALHAGDIVLLSHGSAHQLHDGSGKRALAEHRYEDVNVLVSENAGTQARLDMLCGRFAIAPPHDRLVREYLPAALVVSTRAGTAASSETSAQLESLTRLMRIESVGERLGGHAILDALSSMLFALTIRLASEQGDAPAGLLGLAALPRLAPAVSAMLNEPARPWTVPELAERCSMSRATFLRQFQKRLGRSAHELLLDLRMSLAANALRDPQASTERIAEAVGYQSVAAFRRAFRERTGTTPGAARRGHAGTGGTGAVSPGIED
ncbi:AraC family transcriptional regulator [Burkholderia sp. Cy-637]|uniref:cupin domain-containing protein n=1 Tax=Burkholderia sp. Cy-637 TaxID=2608327 RepID=UPI001421315C|nr:AraC family transcriptional regulator [Burkholderia sp. Cy-637]NIF87738.1 AraC family transcriptional regulator [Burkholderia sp. Cy-637]